MHQTILDHLSTALIGLNVQLKVVYINTAAEFMLGVSSARVQGKYIGCFIDDSDFLQDLINAREEQRQYIHRDKTLQTDQSSYCVDYHVTPIRGSDMAFLVECQLRDNVQRITREESLMFNQETSKSMVRGLAHEIKNPLGGIRGAAQLLSRELKESELDEFTDVIIQEADRLRDLVDRMLGPLQPPEMKALNIHQVLGRVIQLINAETEGRLGIVQDYDPSIPEIPGDAERLIQTVLNIARNAMQAIEAVMPLSEGRLVIKTRALRQFTIGQQKPRQVCHISIMDNGVGIPPALSESIFYPMISSKPQGSGLGLPLSQSIVSQHHGLIECESQPDNTVFHIYLPLESL